MPPTPSTSFSVIIHILIIIWNKFLYRILPAHEIKKENGRRLLRLNGFFVVFVVFILTITPAVILVWTSVTSPHSSVALIKGGVSALLSKNSRAQDAVQISAAAPTSAVSDCTRFFDALAAFYNRSLYDYMTAHGYNPSLDARRELAASVGIAGYQGTFEQNTAMLNYFCQHPLP